MLVIYNETKTEWIRKNIDEKTYKINATKTLTDNKVRYIDMLVSGEIDIPNISEYTSMENCAVLYGDNTSVKFKKKDLKPFITKSNEYNTDIIIVNISLAGKIVKNIAGEKTSILAYLIANGELFLIMSVRNDGDSSFEITLHDSHMIADTIYKFSKTNGTYSVNVDMVQVEEAIGKPSFKIMMFRPARPTHVIFVNDSDVDALKSVLKYPDSHTINACMDHDISDMESFIGPLKRNNYKAVTLFVKAKSFFGEKDRVYGKEFEMLKNNFKFVNILLEDGKTLRK